MIILTSCLVLKDILEELQALTGRRPTRAAAAGRRGRGRGRGRARGGTRGGRLWSYDPSAGDDYEVIYLHFKLS